MLASTWMDMVIGVDIHFEMVIIPPAPPVPTPFPNPFIGMVIDPAGLAVGLALGAAMALATGGTPTGPVLINFMPATNVGTEAKGMGHILIPPGSLWVPMPKFPKPSFRGPPEFPGLPVKPEDDAVSIMGSTTVSVMGSSAVRMGEMWMSCGEPLRMPSSAVIAIPKGPLVMIGGPPGVNLMDALLAMIKTKWVAGYMHSLISRIKNARLRNMLSKAACFLTGHPVDVASGRLLTDNVDFELPGPLPLKFERSYASSWSHRDGPLGPGWSHSLDQAVWFERGKVVYLADDGREIEFDVFDLPDHVLSPGQDVYEPINQLTLRFRRHDLIEIETHDGETREFAPPTFRGEAPRSGWWRLQRRRSRARHEIALTYDDRGNLQWVRDSGGRVIAFDHDDNNRLVRVRLPHPSQDGFVDYLRYFYDAEGDLVQVTDALGASWTFAYKRHLMVRETNRNGLSFYFAYDGWGSDAYCVRTWGDGGIYDHVIDYSKGVMTVVTNSLGYKTAYMLNAIGQVVEVVDARGGSTKYEYEERGLRKTKETTPLGAEILFEYDERGNVVRTTDAAGEQTEFSVDRLNRPVLVKKEAGAWAFDFDDRGYLLESRNPCGERTRYGWFEGLLRTFSNPGGDSTELEYDQWKNLSGVRFADGSHVEYRHDRWGRMVWTNAETGVVTQVEYDVLSRARRMTQNGGHIVELEYDAEGRAIASDKNGERTRYGYSGFRLTERHNSDGTSVRLRYDTEEQLRAFQNENAETWTFELDECGLPTSETAFDGRTFRYERGSGAEVQALTTPSGRKTKFAYDKAGRLLSSVYADGSSESFEYGPGGAWQTAVADNVRVEWKRDALGRVLEEVQNSHAVTASFGHGRPTTRKSSLGLNEHFAWDARDRLAKLTLNGKNPGIAFEFDYWQGGALRSVTSPNQVTARSTVDGLGHLMGAVTTAPGRAREQRLEWRNPEHIARIFDGETGPVTLEQDGRNRLRSVASVRGAQAWRLDGVGNRFPDRSEWRYESGGRLVWADGTSLAYDEDGNLTEKRRADGSAWRFQWTDRGLLRQVIAPDGLRARFSYDALSRRTRKELFRVNTDGAPVVEQDTTYVWSGSQLIHEIAADGSVVTWHWGPSAQTPIARSQGDRRHTFVHNHLGVPIEAYDERGNLVWQMDLDASGNATIDGDPNLCPWRWPGQYADAETGLYYNRYRYYDPEHAHYVSPDPIGLFGGNAPYAYVRDPWTQTDFLGLAGHHPIPQQLVQQMAERGLIDRTKLPSSFADTVRDGTVELAHTPGAHAHSQAHAALSEFLNAEHGLNLRKGTQWGSDWAAYLNKRGSTDKVFADLDKFYRQWLPEQVAAGKYPLLQGEVEAMAKAYEHERPVVEGCKK